MDDPRDFNHFIINAETVEKGPQRYECTPDNTVLYIHDPLRFPEYDHLFRTLTDEELPEEYRNTARNIGGFIWREILGDRQFEQIAQTIASSFNFQVIYRPAPLKADQEQYIQFAQSQLGAELDDINPEDFL